MRRRLLFACPVTLLALAAAHSVLASGARNVDIPERARGASKVVVARAGAVTPQWRTNSFGDRLIVTEVSLDVEETLKGTPASSLWLDVEGGTLDGFTLHVSSMPEVKAGDRAVFFLDETENGWHVPHLKGMGILKLDTKNQVQSSSLRLDDLRRMVQSAGK